MGRLVIAALPLLLRKNMQTAAAHPDLLVTCSFLRLTFRLRDLNSNQLTSLEVGLFDKNTALSAL